MLTNVSTSNNYVLCPTKSEIRIVGFEEKTKFSVHLRLSVFNKEHNLTRTKLEQDGMFDSRFLTVSFGYVRQSLFLLCDPQPSESLST